LDVDHLHDLRNWECAPGAFSFEVGGDEVGVRLGMFWVARCLVGGYASPDSREPEYRIAICRSWHESEFAFGPADENSELVNGACEGIPGSDCFGVTVAEVGGDDGHATDMGSDAGRIGGEEEMSVVALSGRGTVRVMAVEQDGEGAVGADYVLRAGHYSTPEST